MARGTESAAEPEVAPPPATRRHPDDGLDFKARIRLVILGGSSVLLVILWSVLLARGFLGVMMWLFRPRG